MERIKQEIIDKAEKELQTGYREIILDKFKNKENVIIKIYHPDIGVQSELSTYYAKKYNEVLRDPTSKIPTRKQMLAILREKEIWTDKNEENIKKMREKLNNVEIEVIKERGKEHPNTAKIERLKNEYDKIRAGLMEEIMARENSLGQTIEALADRDTNLLKLVKCVKYEDDSCVWKNIDELKIEHKEPKLYDIMTEANYFWNGINREVLELLPEKLFSLGANDLEKSQKELDGKESTQ